VADDVPTVLLIGHNDGIGQLAAELADNGPSEALSALREKYPTGALAVLRVPDGPWSDLKVGAARLLAFVRPRDLAKT
jgi:phosphohistidine phosphatase